MRECTKAVLKELADMSESNLADHIAMADKAMVDRAVGPVKRVHERYWKFFK